MPLGQVTAFASELGKIAGLGSDPANLSSGVKRLLSGSGQKALPGMTSPAAQAVHSTSPAAAVPPPPVFSS